MSDRVVYLMRGLPACGKSFTARTLAGATGVVLETDEYFCTPTGSASSTYHYRDDQLAAARQWILERFERALNQGCTPIVLDRGNGLNEETRAFARLAVDHGYRVELREPDSPWWQELRAVLKNRPVPPAVLDHWSDRLAALSRSTHRVPVATIRRWMAKWHPALTVEEILSYHPTR